MNMAQGVETIAGVLLAGGQSRRMGGGDKCLLPLAGRTVLARVLERLRPQVGQLVLNANGDPSRFSDYGLDVIPDVIGGFAGPLAGVLTGMEWARQHAAHCTHIVTAPTDAPFMPRDLVARLYAPIADGRADLTCARSGGRDHPVVGVWPVALAEDLRRAMVEEDIRKVDRWTARHRLIAVEFDAEPVDPFFNMNRPDDMADAEDAARKLDQGAA